MEKKTKNDNVSRFTYKNPYSKSQAIKFTSSCDLEVIELDWIWFRKLGSLLGSFCFIQSARRSKVINEND